MKRFLSFFVAFMLCLSGLANATQLKATFGDKNTSNVYRLSQYTDTTTGTNYGWVVYAQNTGIVYPYKTYNVGSVSVGNNQLVTSDSGAIITDFGGVAADTSAPVRTGLGGTYVLPPAGTSTTLGTRYTISAGSRSFVTVDTSSTSDVILYSISGSGLAAGDSIKSTGQAGDAVTLECTAANTWTVVDMKSVWTDNN